MGRSTITELLGDDFCRAVGSIAALRGEVRFTLLSAGDQLLATRLGDQGLARLLIHEQDIKRLCEGLRTLAEARSAPAEALDALDRFVSDFAADCDRASEVATGSWTFLGGFDEKHFGLFAGQKAMNGDLHPQWNHLVQGDLNNLVARLEQAVKSLEKFVWGCRMVGAETMARTNQDEADQLPPRDEPEAK